MGKSLADEMLAMLTDLIAPLAAAASDVQSRNALFATLGHTSTVTSNPALLATLQGAATLSTEITTLDPSTLDSWTGVQQVLDLGKQADTLIKSLQQLASEPGLATVAEALAEEVGALLLASWLRRRHRTVFSVCAFFTLVKLREKMALKPAVLQGGAVVRNGYLLDEFDFGRVSDLMSKPGEVLLATYLPNGMATAPDAQLAADRLFPYLGFLADALGVSWRTSTASALPALTPGPVDGSDDEPGPDSLEFDGDNPFGDADDDSDAPAPSPDSPTPIPDSFYAGYFPTFSLIPFQNDTTQLRIDLKCSSLLHPGKAAGLVLGFSGTFNESVTEGPWKLTFTATGEIPAVLLSPTGVSLALDDSGLTDGSAKLLMDYSPSGGSSGPAFVFGSATGTRLELGTIKAQAGVTWSGTSGVSALVGCGASKCDFVISGGDGDGFISSVLPSSGLTANFEFAISWASGSGFAFNGGAGLDTTLSVGISIGGVLTIPTVHLGLGVNQTGVTTEISASVGLAIGPVQALVDRIGINANLNFPSAGESLGVSDLGVAFKPPSGVGLSIDSAGVTGGGMLSVDSTKHEYSGMLQLEFNDLSLQAFGLITTQVAGGSGYSLLAMIDADFPPVQLGWGFTLNGVGGLVAVHRTADTDALRAALKADKLATILFPKSAISNAPLVLAQLDALFPTAEGRFLFGPMALIGWGTPTLLTVALAVILELPEPVRILLLARLAVRLPSPTAPLVKINMDALGVLDLSQGQFALDATLYDSKITGFTLTGDMSLRANWGTQREFLLAIGGFHPQFTPPTGFPSLQRVTIDMPSKSISKLRLAAYLAITSNTLQFGADLDVFIGVSGFGLSGHLAFDAMLQYVPLHFDADISASIALMAGGDTLMSVGLDATLSGPGPWNIAGKFKIHFFFFDVHLSFSATWGDDTPALPIPPVDVLALLTTAFGDSRNWGTLLPDNVPALVSLRSQDGTTVIAHPMAQLEAHERVVPLDLQITRFGAAPITGASTFSITAFTVGTWSGTGTKVLDDFAPAQFFDLTDEEKLEGPSFEQHDAGVRIDSFPAKSTPQPLVKTITYETWYVDTAGGTLREDSGQKQTVAFPGSVRGILMFGAMGQAAIWNTAERRFKNSAGKKQVSVKPLTFTIASTVTLSSSGLVGAGGVTYSAAKAVRAKTAAKEPAMGEELQVIGLHEMAVS